MASLIGKIINKKYKIMEKLNTGKFSTTFLVEKGDINKEYLLKVYCLQSVDAWPLYKPEALIINESKVKGVPRLIDCFGNSNRLCCVEEYIKGITLKDLILKKGQLSENEIKIILKAVLNILEPLHDNGILHLNIKPENIIVNQDLTDIYLIDFGKIRECIQQVIAEKKVSIISSEEYSPPELLQDKKGPFTDIYALGTTLAQASTGKDIKELQDDKGDLILDKVNISDKLLLDIINKMVQYDDNLRYQNVKDILNSLDNLPIQPSIPDTVTEPEEKPKTRKKIWIIASIIVLLIILVMLALFLFKSDEKREVNIITEPEKVKIYTNNTLAGESPLSFKIDRSIKEINIKAMKKDYFTKMETIQFNPQESTRDILIKLKKKRRIMGGITFAYIPGGTFSMGSPSKEGDNDEHPRHKVTVSTFWMSIFEITQKQYRSIMGKNPSTFKGNSNPVDSVSWGNAVDFCKKFSKKYGVKIRLPYEAEWEYAAKAGTTTKYYWGNSMNKSYCWYTDNSGNKTQPIGRKKPNKFGLHDILGNVDEWCQDWYDTNYYRSSPKSNPKGPAQGYPYRVLRGGSWAYDAKFLRCSDRYKFHFGDFLKFNGFRVVSTSIK